MSGALTQGTWQQRGGLSDTSVPGTPAVNSLFTSDPAENRRERLGHIFSPIW